MASPSAQPNGHTSPQPLPQPQPQGESLAKTSKPAPDPEVPLTSATDDGTSRRPRDARLLHLVLSAQGIHSYQERVPLQLLDFAYRYTSSVLSDALRLAGEGYTGTDNNARPGRGRGGGGAGGEEGSIGVTALRQAIASRQDFAFQGGHLPKEFMLEQAQERNRVGLPKVERRVGGGVELPDERFCLTGAGWGLKGEWESEEEDDDDEEGAGGEVEMGEVDREVEGEGDEEEEGEGRMEDVFGEEGGGGRDVDMSED